MLDTLCVPQGGWDSITFKQEETHNKNCDLYFRDAVQSQYNANRSFVLRFYLTSCLSTDEYLIENKVYWEVATSFLWLIDWILTHVKIDIMCLIVILTKWTNKPKTLKNIPLNQLWPVLWKGWICFYISMIHPFRTFLLIFFPVLWLSRVLKEMDCCSVALHPFLPVGYQHILTDHRLITGTQMSVI